MNILLLGSGGREHAIAHKISESSHYDSLFIAPGNPGTAQYGENIDLKLTEFNGILAFCRESNIELVIVGPEQPLVEGIYDFLTPHSIKVVGPSSAAAQLEGSKYFAKVFMDEMSIPTAKYAEFTLDNIEDAYDYIDNGKTPIVLKADGLAAGKGVIISNSKQEAKKELKEMLSGKFGDAGNKVVIEEFLDGIEFSVFVLTDGDKYTVLPTAKDYKRIGENDTGLNTGGMGAISPVPFVTDEIMNKVTERIIKPTIQGIKNRKLDYKGFVFIGLILVNNEPYVIEYNVRMGDPETEVVFPRIEGDIVRAFDALFDGTLDSIKLSAKDSVAATIMLVSGGYPEAYKKGIEIDGVKNIMSSKVYHAGTKYAQNKLITNGGRVMAITSLGKSIQSALEISYNNIESIKFEGQNYRRDIGKDLLKFV